MSPLDGQHSQFRSYPAPRGKTTRFSVCCEHAVARNDDGKRIFTKCLPHGACGRAIAELEGDLTIGHGCATAYRSGNLVYATIERGHTLHIEFGAAQVYELAAQ